VPNTSVPMGQENRQEDRQDDRPNAPALPATSADVQIPALERYLRHLLQCWIDVPPAHRIDRIRPLHSQGVDSITALALQRKLESTLQIPVKTSHPLPENSLADIAALLAGLIRASTRGDDHAASDDHATS
jgi:hypothetical protein